MKVQISHKCNHSREIEVHGVREARQYSKWLSEKDCPDCQDKADRAAEKAAHDLAVTQLMQMGVKPLASNVFMAPSQSEKLDHLVMTDENGTPDYCSCKWFKNTKFATKPCKHAEAVLGYIQEEQEAHKQAVA